MATRKSKHSRTEKADPTIAAGRLHDTIEDGYIFVFSDAHYWPGEATTAHRGMIALIKELKPKIIVCNGDAFDGASISRHPRIGWDSAPSVTEELEAVRVRLAEIEKAAKGASLYWPIGNHDARFETYLADKAPQFEGVAGFALKDHFPAWTPCMSVWINGDLVIKHRLGGGANAASTNARTSGKSMVTGHLHSLKVSPITDYNGTRFGVDTGTLARPYGQQFLYTEDNPVDWRAGFAVFKFIDGKMMWPQVAVVREEGVMEYCGKIYNV